MQPTKYTRNDSSNKPMGMDYARSRNFGDDRDEALQTELGVRKAYVMQPPGERSPGFTLETAQLPNAREGTFNPTTPEKVRSRDVSDTFSTSENNLRQKFINVNEFEKTSGARTKDSGTYGYPNFSTNEGDNAKPFPASTG